MTFRARVLLVVIAVAAAAAIGSSGAQAASPGSNGRIAFGTGKGIGTVGPDGRGYKRITAGDDSTPSWSPDGSRIAFARRSGGQSDVWVVNADGSRLRRLTSAPGAESHPSWSPDGSKIAYDSAAGISLMRASGGSSSFVAAGSDPAWSPDGGRIAYISNEVLPGDYRMGPHGSVWTVKPDGSDAQRVRLTSYAADPDWSPDGSRIAFDMTSSAGAVAWTNADGSSDVNVLGDDFAEGSIMGSPGFSPDGRYVAYSRVAYPAGSASGVYSIAVETVSTGSTRTIAVKGADRMITPDWQAVSAAKARRLARRR